MNIENDLTAYLAKLGNIPIQEINPEVKIYNSGILSSLKLIELMAYIEKQYGFIIKPEELIEENFKDVGTIVNFIRNRTYKK
jgi:acyl carrier protein